MDSSPVTAFAAASYRTYFLAAICGVAVLSACGDSSSGGDAPTDAGPASQDSGSAGSRDGGGARRDSGSGGQDAAIISACPGGFANCDGDPDTGDKGCETNIGSLDNCGGCGISCGLEHATPRCDIDVCIVSACEAGYADCDSVPSNGCETDTRVTDANCGACGNDCGALAKCLAGACVLKDPCPTGFDDCNNDPKDGCETALNQLNNCGFCGEACTVANGTASCDTGSCEIACTTVCGAADPTCTEGECVEPTCDAGWGDCDAKPETGCETSLETLGNCGACGAACNFENASETCASGTCTFDQCNDNYDDCNTDLVADGCETQINTISHCGDCSTVCSVPAATNVCVDGGGGYACDVSNCAAGYYSTGGGVCNCQDVPLNSHASCATAVTLATVVSTTPVTQIGNVPVPGAADWYKINFTGPTGRVANTGIKVWLDTAGSSANFRIDVWNDTCVSPLTVDGGQVAEAVKNWEFYDTCTSPHTTSPSQPNICQTNATPRPTTVHVRVWRVGAILSCEQYTLKASHY